ncbi:hypothetical protein MED121_09038 [Marinomonas sp. MED121]|uniref:glycosyltransferase n=1 Tax=Marinomonas sp. MED121 TaxID=314277 RepID=UPI00006900EC|nr:glycosyltransferase [Marinomonas sp. MED121]EAQ65698.1 hypothetical protein MED121_09038 [Marinomonas sp. MED121]
MKKIKKKIYFLLSSEAYLEPISGDRINEMNIVRALISEYDVYYNGVLASMNDVAFGDKEKKINTPKKGEYDLVYVRNNRNVFLNSPSPKLWFASPYDKECFEQADGIVCMTKPWKKALSEYSSEKYKYFCETYPIDMKAPKHCVLFPQVIDNSSFNVEKVKSNEIKQGFKNKLKQNVKRIFGISNKTIIRHFGPIRQSNYPYQIIECLNNKNIASKLTAETVGAGKKLKIPKSIKNTPRLPQAKVAGLLNSADAIWYNQDASGHIAGSLKVLEAMAAGVPILLPRYDAREEELGKDYPLFWDLKPGSTITDPEQPDFTKKLRLVMTLTEKEREKISINMKKRALAHSYENVANEIKVELEFFWGVYNETKT